MAKLVGLGGWISSLPEQTRQAMAEVEMGRGMVIPRDEYAAYQAWRANGANGGARPAPGAPPAAQQPVAIPGYDPNDATDVERAMAARIQELEAQGQQQFDAATRALQQQQQAALDQHLTARAQVFEKAFLDYGAEMALTPAEVNEALQYAGENRIIASVNERLAVRSPFGQPIQEADPSAVARATLEQAAWALPTLRQKLVDRQVEDRVAKENADIIKINEKKSRSGSLSTAPAAATTTGRDPRTMSDMEIEAAMANELRLAMSQ